MTEIELTGWSMVKALDFHFLKRNKEIKLFLFTKVLDL